ncbi:MAG: hypothetical protein U9Q34_03325, partial [Elusimicrobiota bacterium]|nr:hypothetical protein [Elusimicrobiota bacterium]
MKRKYLNNKSLCAAVFLYIVFYGGLFSYDNKKMDDYFCNEIKKPFFKIGGKNKDGAIIIPGRSQGRDFSFIMPKPKGVKRIFIIGESVAGLMYWQIPLVKDSIKNPEIVNCGMGAYESGRILDVFIEIMDYEPDLIVVLSGNNEMVGDPCRGIAAEMRRRLRMIKINAKRIFSGLKMKESEYFINIKTHEERLRKMVKIAREKKVPVVLCTLPANMKDFSPFGSLPFEIKNFAKAYFLMETGHYKKAKKIFEAILTENPKEPFNHFYLAKILESLGKFNEAKRHYELAIEWDNRMDRSSKERNKMIREVTKEEGACLADLEKSFMDVSKNKIIGGDLIVDGVHWFGKHNDFVISQALKFMEKCDNAGAMFKKNKISKLKKMNFGDFKEEDDNKKEALEMFYYGIAFLTNEMKSGKINERALMIFERAYEADKNLIYDASKSKESLRKYIKENFWTKEIMNPVSVGVWRPDFLHHIAELFRRKGKLNKAKKNIDKALKLAPKELRFSLTRRLILKGMEKNVSAGDLNEVVLSYNSDLLRKE